MSQLVWAETLLLRMQLRSNSLMFMLLSSSTMAWFMNQIYQMLEDVLWVMTMRFVLINIFSYALLVHTL
jgi:hypothetical protein